MNFWVPQIGAVLSVVHFTKKYQHEVGVKLHKSQIQSPQNLEEGDMIPTERKQGTVDGEETL